MTTTTNNALPAPNSQSNLYATVAFYLPLAVIYIKILTPIMDKNSLGQDSFFHSSDFSRIPSVLS